MAVTATFRLVYVVLVLEVGSRRIRHWNTTAHQTAEWTTQQFRTFLNGDDLYRFVVHDRDTVFSPSVDDVLRSTNLRVLTTPARVAQGKAFCERGLIGTARRECLDYFISFNERHLRTMPAEWVCHDNQGRPGTSLGPGIPEPAAPIVSRSAGHQLPNGHRIAARPILGGLHHEYRL